ncbi:MAG: transglutaminaseTgpA domain-containing protein [Pseudomonadota bacterium]
MILRWRPDTWRQDLRQRWQSLTREGRDTLWLLGMLALVLAPHAERLPWWANLGATGALAWRARLAWTDGPLPKRWLLAVMLGALLAMSWLTYRTLIGREPGITLVVVLTTLKCLELRARRDSLVCLYLGFFLILTQFFYSQGIGTAVLMLVAVWGLLTSLVMGQRPLGRPPIAEVGRDALRAMAWGLPLMVVLFVLFPRFGPLWALPTDAKTRTGLSETLSLGQVAELAQDDSIALRVRFNDKAPAPEQLYFRGPTLDRFDGKTWRPGAPASPEPALEGRPIAYEVTLEPAALPILPLLEGTGEARVIAGGDTRMRIERAGLAWYRQGGRDGRLILQAQAWPRWHWPDTLPEHLQRYWTLLPQGYNPGTLAWAAQLRQQLQARQPDPLAPPSPLLLANAVMGHIRTAGYSYTLAPGLPDQPTPHLIDAFWLQQKEGFCEHFATAFVVVMRAMGVPARVVTGYQGAELNPVDGQYIVRNSSAHAWAEFWQPGRGWVRADPTAAVAPERVQRAPRPTPFAGLPGPLSQLDPGALRRMRDLWDAVDNRWNTWVLQYSRGEQMALLKSLGWPQPDLQALMQALAWGLGLAGGVAALVAWWTRERTPRHPWQEPLRRVHRALSRLPVAAPPGMAPAAASAWRVHLLQAWPEPRTAQQEALLRLLHQLDALRYGPPTAEPRTRASAPWIALVRQIEALSRPGPASPHGANSSP